MIAAAPEGVPDLWESAGDWACWVDRLGQVSDFGADVYARWTRGEVLGPHVCVILVHGPFQLSLTLLADQARELAAQLVRAAELVEATQAALDAERSQEQNPCFSK